MAERVTAWLRRLAGRGALVLLGDPGRAYLPRDGMEALAKHTVPTTLDLEDRTERETTIWRLLPA
jgi:predicted nicotinamide N-methyase